MKKTLKTLLLSGLVLFGVNSYSSEALAKKYLNVDGIEFNCTVPASLQKKYAPEVMNKVTGKDFDFFSYLLLDGKVRAMTAKYIFSSELSATNQWGALYLVSRELLSYYSGVPIDDIKQNLEKGTVKRIIAYAKDFYAVIELKPEGDKHIVLFAFLKK